MSHPYREAYIPPPEPIAPKKHPREIIKAAEMAIDKLNEGCSQGIILTLIDKPTFKYASPHSHAYTLHSYGGYTITPCCQPEREALKEVKTLTGLWRYWARLKLKNKKIYYNLIGTDEELKDLLLSKEKYNKILIAQTKYYNLSMGSVRYSALDNDAKK